MEPVGILVPSLNRSHLLEAFVGNIRHTTTKPYKIHFCVSDQASIDILTKLGEDFITDDGGTVIERVNRMYAETDEPLFYYCGDDDWHELGWLDVMRERLADSVDMVVSQDNSTTLIRRSYIEQQSGCADVPKVVLYPGYTHNFSEVELICMANKRGVVTWCDQPTITHRRHLDGQAPYDDTYKRGDDSWDQDVATFNQREAALFPGARYF